MKKISCNLCGSKDHIFLFKSKDRLHNVPGEFGIVKCKNCGLVFINPQPSQKELEKYYPKKYFTHGLVKNTLKEKARKIIYKTYYGPKSNLFLKLFFFPYYNLRGIPYKKDGKILDIGCGNGRFLLDCKNIGWDVYGVETDKNAAEIAKKNGIKIYNNLNNFNNNFFDTITMWNSLEHLPDPVKTLKKVKRILKEKGDLIIEIPDIDSFTFKIFKNKWYSLDAPRHLYHFSISTIKIMCNKLGFNIIKFKYNSRPSQFLGSLQYTLNNKINLKNNFLFKQIFKIPAFVVNKLKIGDSVIIYTKKV